MQSNTILNPAAHAIIFPYQQQKEFFVRGGYPRNIDGELELSGRFLWQEWSCIHDPHKNAEKLATAKRLYYCHGSFAFLISYQPIPLSSTEPNVLPPDHIDALRILARDPGGACGDAIYYTARIPISWDGFGWWATRFTRWAEHQDLEIWDAFRMVATTAVQLDLKATSWKKLTQIDVHQDRESG